MLESPAQPPRNEPIVFHPVCLALYHVFVLYALYEEQTPVSALFRPALVVIALTSVLYIVLRAAIKSTHKAGVFTSLIVVAALTGWTCLEYVVRSLAPLAARMPIPYVVYASIAVFAVIAFWFFNRDTAPRRARRLVIATVIFATLNAIFAELVFARFFDRSDSWFISTYLCIVVAIFWCIAHYVEDYVPWTSAMNRFGSILVVLSILIVAFYMPRAERTVEPIIAAQPVENIPVDQAKDQPDIYFLAFGGYAHNDVLRTIFDCDNTKFTDSLRERGFRNVNFAMANYSSPILSLTSCMNMEYLQDLVTDPEARENATDLTVGELFQNAQVFNTLKRRGYELLVFSSGSGPLDPKPPSLVPLRPPEPLNEFETMLLEGSIATRAVQVANRLGLASAGDFQTCRERDRVQFVFERLNELSSKPRTGPRFVVAPIGLPEAPFLFEPNGTWNKGTMLRAYHIGESFRGSRRTYIDAYKKQLEFTNARVLSAVDSIFANSAIPPVIILASMNGPRSHRQGLESARDFTEEYFVYASIYIPPQYTGAEFNNAEAFSLVNMFRYVLNVVFNEKLERKPDVHYVGSDEKPLELKAVTVRMPTR
jgi:hypothetical protein